MYGGGQAHGQTSAGEKSEVRGLSKASLAWSACFEPFAIVRRADSDLQAVRIPGQTAQFLVPVNSQIEAGTAQGAEAADGAVETLAKGTDILLTDRAVVMTEGAMSIRQGTEKYLVSDIDGAVLLKLAAGETVRAALLEPATAVRRDGVLYLRSSPKVSIPALAVQPLSLAEAPLVRPYFADTANRLRTGFGSIQPLGLSVRLPRPEKPLVASGLAACMSAGLAGPGAARPALVAAVRGEDGTVSVDLELPAGALTFAVSDLRQRVRVAVATKDGQLAKIGQIQFLTPVYGLLIATLATLALVVLVAYLLKDPRHPKQSFWAGLFMGYDGSASLTLLQMALWTTITVWALIYVFLRTWELLSVTTEVMTLLGFAGATTVGARVIAAARVPAVIENGAAKPVERDPARFRFAQLFQSAGRFDLVKLQLFVFTLLIACYVVFRVLWDGAFPALDGNFLLLMGISNGAYIMNKFVGKTAFQKAEEMKNEVDVLQQQVATLEAELKSLEERKADLTKQIAAAMNANETALGESLTADLKRVTDRIAELGDAKDATALPAIRAERDAKLKSYREAVAELAK